MGIFDSVKSLFGSNQTTPQTSAQTAPAANGKKVIIIEDEVMLAEALEVKFKNAGFTVFKAGNGQEGLQTIQTQKPDVVLLDLMMPIMDGKTMLRKLREIPEFKELPVFILTNAGDVDNMRETTTFYNAKEFIVKSNVDPSQIVDTVKHKLFINT